MFTDLHPAPVSTDQPEKLRGAFFLGGQAADIGALYAALDAGAFYYGGFVHQYQSAQAGLIGLSGRGNNHRHRLGSFSEKRGQGRVRTLG